MAAGVTIDSRPVATANTVIVATSARSRRSASVSRCHGRFPGGPE